MNDSTFHVLFAHMSWVRRCIPKTELNGKLVRCWYLPTVQKALSYIDYTRGSTKAISALVLQPEDVQHVYNTGLMCQPNRPALVVATDQVALLKTHGLDKYVDYILEFPASAEDMNAVWSAIHKDRRRRTFTLGLRPDFPEAPKINLAIPSMVVSVGAWTLSVREHVVRRGPQTAPLSEEMTITCYILMGRKEGLIQAQYEELVHKYSNGTVTPRTLFGAIMLLRNRLKKHGLAKCVTHRTKRIQRRRKDQTFFWLELK